MPEELEKQVEEKTVEPEGTKPEEKPEKPEAKEKPVEEPGYVKIRTERAAEKARKELLEELGVASLDEARDKIQDGAKALEIATEVKSQIEAEKAAKVNITKANQLKELFKDTFDPEVLVQLTNLEDIELNEDGTIKDAETVLAKAREQRPRFFGTTKAASDSVATNTGSLPPKTEIEQAYEAGNYTKVVSAHLNEILNKK